MTLTIKTGLAICLMLSVGLFAFASFVFADAGHDEAPDSHGMTVQVTDRSAQLPNIIGGFALGVVIGLLLARFIFKKS